MTGKRLFVSGNGWHTKKMMKPKLHRKDPADDFRSLFSLETAGERSRSRSSLDTAVAVVCSN